MDTMTYSQSNRPQGQQDCGGSHRKEDFGVMCSWDDLPLCFGIDTLAILLHCKLGKARKICRSGELTCYKEGKSYVIFKQDLIEWLEQRKKATRVRKSA